MNILHYDIARGCYLRPEEFKKAMKLARDNSFDAFLPYLENMLQLKTVEKACPSCAITPNQWREYGIYAGKIGIELFGHFNVIGHTAAIRRAYPELGEEEFNPASATVKQWMIDSLAEYCSFFNGRYMLIGGDEWQAPSQLLKDPEFKAGIAWAEYLNTAIEFLTERNITPIVWHDVLFHYPETFAILSRKAIIAFWYYHVNLGGYPGLKMLREHGFRTIAASSIKNGAEDGRLAALRMAKKEQKKYRAEGIMVTSWEEVYAAQQNLAVPIAGKILREVPLSEEDRNFIRFSTVTKYLSRIPETSPHYLQAKKNQQTTAEKLTGERDFFVALAQNNHKVLLADFARRCYPEGPRWNKLNEKAKHEFSLRQKHAAGRWLQLTVTNGDEQFSIYPDFGWSLQNWHIGDLVIVEDHIKDKLGTELLPPGGYRSYTKILGFRPAWSVGAGQHPCIVWQYPFVSKVLKETSKQIVVEFQQTLPHVCLQYRLRVSKDRQGFELDLRARNLIENLCGAFTWNLPIQPHDIKSIREMLFIHSNILTMERGRYRLEFKVPRRDAAGFRIDRGKHFFTPDLQGKFRFLRFGQIVESHWDFNIIKHT
ncbi:MAG: Glycosyl hydrolase family 20, catalytic domain [Lentisphaerae bacterium ADurb.Bin242]|nr:MAG: Glycosyl hydrolase family 20, catalytic domain [Lentisphaerae bacterium ADurb.Bin242]